MPNFQEWMMPTLAKHSTTERPNDPEPQDERSTGSTGSTT